MALDIDYVNYEAAMVTPPSVQWRTATNRLFADWKAALGVARLSDAFDVIYLFTAESEQAALLNAAKRGHDATNYGMAFEPRVGFAGDGAADYMSSNYNPAADGAAYAVGDALIGLYFWDNPAEYNPFDMGSYSDSAAPIYYYSFLGRGVGGSVGFGVNSSHSSSSAVASTGALLAMAQRYGINNGETAIYNDGVASATTGDIFHNGLTAYDFYIGALNLYGTALGHSQKQYGAAFIGRSLTATQHANFYGAWADYLVALALPPESVYQPDLHGWELHLRHYGRDGGLKNGYIAPLSCRYTQSLDSDEPLVFILDGEGYAGTAMIAEYDILEVMIRNRFLGVAAADGGFVRDFVGIVRGDQPDRVTDDNGITMLTWYAPEQKHCLSWRRVLWPAGVTNKSRFTTVPAETVVKRLVADNCTEVATVGNGRWRDGDLAPSMGIELDIEADGGAGETISLSFAGASVLDSLAKVCELGGDYYSLDWQGGSFGGAHEFALTWGRGGDKQTGADLVLFSLDNNTMRSPRRRYVAASGTTAVAAGQGEGADRAVSLLDGVDYGAENDIELFVDARNSATADGRLGQGAAKLNEVRAVSELGFEVLLTGDVFYSPVAVVGRKTYRVGDRVLASYGGEEVRRIRRTMVAWEQGEGSPLQVTIETEFEGVA